MAQGVLKGQGDHAFLGGHLKTCLMENPVGRADRMDHPDRVDPESPEEFWDYSEDGRGLVIKQESIITRDAGV